MTITKEVTFIAKEFVDHTHADAVVTISNSKHGQEYIKKLYPNFLIVPYVMTKDFDWLHVKV